MDPDIIRDLLEGQPDALSDEVRREEELFRGLTCPMCYEAGCEKRLKAPRIIMGDGGEPVIETSPFTSDRALPHGYAHCIHCGTDFDPRSGVIMSTEASNIEPADPAAKIVFPRPNPRRE
jgi:hypothetical protein